MDSQQPPSGSPSQEKRAIPFTAQSQTLADGSVVLTWPRDPRSVDDRAEVPINFRPIAGGPVIRVMSLRYRPLDVSGPFGVTGWAFRIPPAEVMRATNLARAAMNSDNS